MPIGEIDGIEAGAAFESRRALHDTRTHSPLQAGIAGGASVGAESIVLWRRVDTPGTVEETLSRVIRSQIRSSPARTKP